MPPIIAKLMQNPAVLGRLREWFGNQPLSLQYGPNAVIGRVAKRGCEGAQDIQALQTRFDTLLGRLRPDQRNSIVARVMEETSDVASLSDRRLDSRTLAVLVGDSQGNEIEIDLNGSINSNSVTVKAGDLIFSDSDGRYRFNTPSGTVVVYNPEMDGLLNEMGYEDLLLTDGDSIRNAFDGCLAEHVVARALMLGEIIPEYRQVTMLSNIVVREHQDFENGQIYGGYLIPARPSGDWVSLANMLPVHSSRELAVTSNQDPIAKLLGAALGGVEFEDELFEDNQNTSGARTFQPMVLRKAIQKLKELLFGLRAVGGIIDPLQVMVDASTGNLWIDPDVEINILDHSMFTDGEGNIYSNPAAGVRNPYDPEAAFVPSAALRSVADDALFFTIKDILWPQLDDTTREVVKKETSRYIARYLFEHVGIEDAARSVRAALDLSDPLERVELIAFYDHLANYIVAEFQQRANIVSDATNEAVVGDVFKSLRNDLSRTIIPQRVLNSDQALRIYERGRRVLNDLVSNSHNRARWNALIRAYLSEHGTRQISMFISMVLPYLAYRNAHTPLNLFSEGHLFVTRNFNSFLDALRWSLFTDQIDPNPDPSDTDGSEADGEVRSEVAGATVHHLFDFRPTDPPSAAQLTPSPTAAANLSTKMVGIDE